jgi:RHS repeat-associated protein
VVKPTGNVVVWKWDFLQNTFGNSVPDQDPDGDSVQFGLELRFPGQYADGETGVNYNYFRDYEPGTGRYVESDPIGLVGGITTYAYVDGAPSRLADPRGLSPFWDAWAHYCDGTGTDWTIPFNMVNWGDAVAIAKRNIERMAFERGCIPGAVRIDENLEAHAGGEYSNVIGRHTVKSSGTLTTHCNCTWSYTGSLSSALGYDPYDFNPSNRGGWGEFKTWVGRNRCDGKPFNIHLPGSIPITLSGFNSVRTPNSCCDGGE